MPLSDRPESGAHDDTYLLEIKDLSVRFETGERSVWAVNGVDLAVKAGEAFAIVGESGSGKSVSMLSVMGLLPKPQAIVSGSIKFAGTELTSLSNRRLQAIRGREIGMVFQDPMSSLNPVHSVGRQIAEAIRLHNQVSRRVAKTRAIELLGRVGIPNPRRRADDYPHEFSGGMRQRAMIAMALSCGPGLLIADEPTTALDVTVQRQIVTLVRDLKDDLGMAVVWITHDLGVVAELADRVAVMYGGRVMETGSASQVYGSTRHPYTAGLLRSIPRLDTPTHLQLPEIPGTPAPILSAPQGCVFHARCPMGQEDCTEAVPSLASAGSETHLTACIHSEEMGSARSLWPMDDPESEAAPTGATGQPIVSIRGLKVYFRSRHGSHVRAVDGVDLDIGKGLTLGIVGESGCGKSTLGRALVGLVEPEEPAITVNGEPLDTSRGAHRKTIQMIFQDPFSSMNPGMRIADIVTEPLRIHKTGTNAERETIARDLLSQVGMPEEAASRYPHEFSGGQRQRIAIARALAAKPDVIVCDEPVSALDVSVQAQIINLLDETQRQNGLALVFIAHDLAVVRHISDEIAVMYLGQVVERAPRDDIYDNPLHPYTKALLASVPNATPEADPAVTPPLEGDLPDPSDPPSGCRFHTRCPVAVKGLCDVEVPALRGVAPRRWVSCHLVDSNTMSAAPSSPGSLGPFPQHPATGGTPQTNEEQAT